jgi:hypothetical protein
MYHNRTWQRFHCFCAICTTFCLLLVLNACGQSSGNGLSSSSSPTYTAASSRTLTPGQAAAAQTCPAQASARAAVMPPGTVENHAAIVYLSQKDTGSTLLRYDVTTGSVQTILQTNGDGAIQAASVSQDGQWILLVSHLQDQSAIQVIRVDGQQLQTLYCAPAQEGIDAALLSPDQHSLVFNQVSADENISILYFLDMTTGKLQTELSPLQANYPESAFEQPQNTGVSLLSSFSSQNTTSARLEANQFNPGPSKHYLFYIPMQWANNSVYLLGTVGGE